MVLTVALTDLGVLGPSGCRSVANELDCSGHGSCVLGRCKCVRGFSGEACEKREYLLACPANCSAASDGGHCEDGRCICNLGRSGDDCADVKPVNCTRGCSDHGSCHAGSCVCFAGFHGLYCEHGCEGFVSSSGESCSGHGLCQTPKRPNRCRCFAGFDGSGCELNLLGLTNCSRACSGRGTCLAGRCAPHFSSQCSPLHDMAITPPISSLRATTSCTQSFWGHCAIRCASRMLRCSCLNGFAGHDCSIELVRETYGTHALDSPGARVLACCTLSLLSAAVARLAFRYVERGLWRRRGPPSAKTLPAMRGI